MNIDSKKFLGALNAADRWNYEGVAKFFHECEINPVDCNECMNFGDTCNKCIHCKYNSDYFEQKQKEWFEDENNFPCLCWVSNEREEKKETASLIIKKYDSNFITKSGISWTYATPLTKEEVLKYCVGENND